MRRIFTALGSALLFALIVVASVPAFAASTTVNITYEQGDNPYAYVPGDVSIQPGDSVTWVNPRSHGLNPAAPHPTRCHTGRSKGSCPWGTFALDEGESHTQTFPAEGTFVYVCSVHPYMEGTVTVGDGDPSQPTPPPETEPSPEPEPEPSPEPEPEPTATTTPTASPTPAGTTAPDEPESGEPTPDASADPNPDPDSPTEDASASEAAAADDPTEAGEVATGTEVEDLAAAAERSSGTGVKVLASLLVLVTGGAVFSVRRNLRHDG